MYYGYFRAQRFAGDFSDFGEEIQTSDFLLAGDDDRGGGGGDRFHVENQRRFLEVADFTNTFDCDAFRPLLARAGGNDAVR